MQLNQLKNRSIHAKPGTRVYWPKEGRIGALDMTQIAAKFSGKCVYNEFRGTLAYIDEEGNFFVTPFAGYKEAALIKSGYAKEDFYVPFSHGDIPLDSKNKWNQLQNEVTHA
ncbi:hypothetical protein IJG89_02560 [Candidatus Saccharibacteria bacterium]|nr:hypothetical protein [Candidatus Saccharibacteria bacterium]